MLNVEAGAGIHHHSALGGGTEERPTLDKGPAPKKTRPVKRLLRAWKRWALGRLGMGLSRLLGSRGRDAFGILMYHRLAPWDKSEPAPTWNVTPERFRRQLAGLLARGYEPWPLRQALTFRKEGRPIPRKAFVVTFDDGYENVHAWAWPILCELKVPATVFLATAYLDRDAPFPFDDWPAAGSPHVAPVLWRPLTTAQCQEMQRSGWVELGSHTHTHEVFLGRPQALYEDLSVSADLLRERFGVTEATFAFPFGIGGPDLAAVVRQAGLLCSLTTRGELVRIDRGPFTWGRFTVEEMDTAGTIAAQLDGWCSLPRKSWQRMEERSLTSMRHAL